LAEFIYCTAAFQNVLTIFTNAPGLAIGRRVLVDLEQQISASSRGDDVADCDAVDFNSDRSSGAEGAASGSAVERCRPAGIACHPEAARRHAKKQRGDAKEQRGLTKAHRASGISAE
jgi:hypothetical protein